MGLPLPPRWPREESPVPVAGARPPAPAPRKGAGGGQHAPPVDVEPPPLPWFPATALLGPPGCCEGAGGADASRHAALARAARTHALWTGPHGLVGPEEVFDDAYIAA